ncbi:MAG: DUF3604 domain-containing protein [Chloroflexota bacterium]|nr:DUF3604 domain-containing protein [Chloroflexota bacterium]MDE2918217.1 DUF3604 domain-containing protein [Chloroflexota bacterium]
MTPGTPTTLPYRVRGGNEPGSLQVTFHPADGRTVTGPDLQLTAGTVGTWELRLAVEAPVGTGGGFFFERYGFLLSHSIQTTRPLGRDYVTLRARTDARVRLELNELNQANSPPVARIVVEEGTLVPGDELCLVVGDTSRGGPGSEVYDVTCHGRLVASVDRSGSLAYRQLRNGEARIQVVPDPEPTLLRLLGPSIARPGEPFALHLAVYDRNHNVCTQYQGTVALRADASPLDDLPPEVTLGPDSHGLAIIEDVTARQPGLIRIEAQDREHGLSALSNPLLVQSDPRTLLLWGDLHSHSWGDVSMGLMDDPTPILHPSGRHAQARGQARLDFAAPGPMAPPEQSHRPAVWQAHQAAYRANDEPGTYVPYLAAEAHPNVGGDRNVVYRDWEERHAPAWAEMDDLVETYGDRDDVLLEAHVGGGPADWDAYPTAREPVVEVASGHGSAEWLLQRALRYGHRPAVIASGDTHLPLLAAPMAAHLFRGRFGNHLNIRDCAIGCGPVAAVRAARCERHATWDAVLSRRTYATTGARIILDVQANGHSAGSEIETEDKPRLTITAHACSPIERIDLICNDRALAAWHPDTLDATYDFEDSTPLPEAAYYVRLRQSDGEYAWSTPIWITCGAGAPDSGTDLPAWNQHEAADLAMARPNDAEAYEDQLLDYLSANEDPAHFHDLTPIGVVDEVPGRAALFHAFLGEDLEPISIRWYFEFHMPRLRLDWGWRDFGTRDGG